MFRNPRENRALSKTAQLTPSTGRPPSPPPRSRAQMAAQTTKKAAPSANSTPASSRGARTQTTLVGSDWSKKPSLAQSKNKRPHATPNGNILTFFKKAEDINNRLFLQERGARPTADAEYLELDEAWSDERAADVSSNIDQNNRYNESDSSCKKRKVARKQSALDSALLGSPQLSPIDMESAPTHPPPIDVPKSAYKPPTKSGPFVDDSESEYDDDDNHDTKVPSEPSLSGNGLGMEVSIPPSATSNMNPSLTTSRTVSESEPPCSFIEHAFEEFEGMDDEDDLEGEEYEERRWMSEQLKLEMEERGFEGDPDDFDPPPMFQEEGVSAMHTDLSEVPSCPICNCSLPEMGEQEIAIHVNACLDGQPYPTPSPSKCPEPMTSNPRVFKRPPKPGQNNPFQIASSDSGSTSAFSKLMAGHAEDAAWASAAAENHASRGKPAYQRTCPFYKIIPGFSIAVDAFRYGAIKGQSAYFLSHFHSDHYVGLTASWCHGPIYCSKVTANLVRQQLRVDPRWVVDLDFEQKTEVPGTHGVHVTMITANHCPGSSLFLFEKEMGSGTSSKMQRVLHCGDFRACQAHIEHPLLRPDVLDAVGGKKRHQKLDVCYLDTTYLNPKYAFPPQQQVIQACADMCVSLSKSHADHSDGWEQTKRERAGQGMMQFVHKSPVASHDGEPKSPPRGRLLVVVGTYSIGKERICVGIANALKSRIYAPMNKQRICRALEDPELEALLTSDPRAAQVHMTPLFEIRADTLDDYLRDYSDTFTRCVGFRPSGWNYRPPNSRFVESPSVQTVLNSQNWRSQFTMKDLTPQRGSTSRASCFGVPYSEHSSFRELTIFCCSLRIDKIIPTVNVGSAKSREKMKTWCERWALDKRKNGLFQGGMTFGDLF